jgi:hypothetical protein
MAESMDVGSLLRHLASGFGAAKQDLDINVKPSPKAKLAEAHDEAVGLVAVTLALMASEAAAEQQYLGRKEAISHIRPI